MVARGEGIQAHFFEGPYSPVLSYSYEFEPCRLYSATRLCVKAGRLVSVWRAMRLTGADGAMSRAQESVGQQLTVFPAAVVAGDQVRDRDIFRTIHRIEYIDCHDEPVYVFRFTPGGEPRGEMDSLDYWATIPLVVWRRC